MKKILLLFALLFSFFIGAQNNPAKWRNGIETKFIALDTLTTAQRDALTLNASKGYVIFNADTNVLNIHDGTSWATVSGGGGLANLVEDLTPQLGGDLDPNGFDISRTGAFNIEATGDMVIGDITKGRISLNNGSFGTIQSTAYSHDLNSLTSTDIDIDTDNNGTVETFRVKANVADIMFQVSENGEVTLPNTTTTDITTAGAKAIITKEYGDANYGGGGGDDVSTFAEKTGDLVGTDRLVGLSGATDFSETISGIPLSIFNDDLTHSPDFSETLQYTGTRLGGNLVTTIGDYDNTGNGSKITLNDATGLITLTGGGGNYFSISGGGDANLSTNLFTNFIICWPFSTFS